MRKYNYLSEHSNIHPFAFSKHGQYWFYIYNNDASDTEKLRKVRINQMNHLLINHILIIGNFNYPGKTVCHCTAYSGL